ncbi:MAG: prephenate dehydratase [Nitrospinota bacterium]
MKGESSEGRERLFEELLGLDRELLRLMEHRLSLFKALKERGEERPLERYQLRRPPWDEVGSGTEGGLTARGLAHIFRELDSAIGAEVDEPFKVSYLGPEATFSHQAGLERFGHGVQYVDCRTIPEVFREVEAGRARFGVVPVENSLEGTVNYTLDMLADSPVVVCGELLVEIALHLLALEGDLREVRKLYSQPHALAQCRGWLSSNLPEVEVVEVASTAAAAKAAREERGAAAIAGEQAAALYGLKVIARKIDESPHNYTRFFVIGTEEPSPSGSDKTSLLFSIRHRAGALYQALAPLARHGINMTKIESRPSRKKAWEYVFYVDVEGHMGEEPLRGALREFEEGCSYLKVLGSYPRWS